MVKHIYTSVDIGSNAINVVVFELCKNKLNLLAASSVKSKGIKKGLIVNFEEASLSMRQSFDEIESMLGIKIKKVIASVPSYFSDYIKVEETIPINNEEKMVTSYEINSVIGKCAKKNNSANREVVTIIPIDFKVDDGERLKNPRALMGNSLSVRAIMVTTPSKNILSVVNLIEHLGVEVVDISINGIGDIYTFRNQTLDKNTGVIISLGSEITSVTLYNKGIPVKNVILQYGGKNIENDISYMYKVDAVTANNLKEKFAFAHTKSASSSDFKEVTDIYGNNKKINQLELSEIVMSRIDEIFHKIKEEIDGFEVKNLEYIILTGGTSNLAQIKLLANEIIGNTTIGNIKVVGVRNNKYSAAIGNIIYFIDKLKIRGDNYSMLSNEEASAIASSHKGQNSSNETMLGKVFGYFFGE